VREETAVSQALADFIRMITRARWLAWPPGLIVILMAAIRAFIRGACKGVGELPMVLQDESDVISRRNARLEYQALTAQLDGIPRGGWP
jgi:hypothetical protein